MRVVISPSYVVKIVNSQKAFELPYSKRKWFSKFSPYLTETQIPAY